MLCRHKTSMSVNWLGKQPEYEVRGNRWLQTDGRVQGNNETVLTSMINHSFQHVEKKFWSHLSKAYFDVLCLEMLS